ncbi:No apical meristem (NAM) protein [Corchorus olitorius]|uniref:No apical meristem (NAM) protein n=1 Tax=Corchorus olitorius TaxID=93759 RepID=A0A1R3GS04_9ROSI|nr:No apical meristem (NAM) protein [Corchorus olitorius]
MFDYDLKNLPVGFKFEPTDQEIVKSYVRPAIEKGYLPNFMIHCDLYIEEPWKLKDDDPEGSTGWVMHEYLAEGLNTTAAICKIQFKASSAKINNNKSQGDQTQMSINPMPHKKPRLENKRSHSHSHDHDQTKGNCDDDSDDIDVFAGYLDAMLEKEKENPPKSSETQEEDCFGQLVPNEANTNPNEEVLGTSQAIDID